MSETSTDAQSFSFSNLRVRDYAALGFQLISCVPLIIAVVASITRNGNWELQGIAFGIVAFSAAVICAGLTLLPGFRASTRAAAWILVLLQAIGWMIDLASGGTDNINM